MSALLVIDMQETYFKTPRLRQQKQQLVYEINRLTAEFNEVGDLVLNIKTIHSTDKTTWTLNMLQDDQGFAFAGSDEAKNVSGLQLDDAIEVIKTRDSAFHGTDLLSILRRHGITTLTLAGVSTHSCIFQTAADAYAYNFRTIIRESAVADEDKALATQALAYLQREYRQDIA